MVQLFQSLKQNCAPIIYWKKHVNCYETPRGDDLTACRSIFSSNTLEYDLNSLTLLWSKFSIHSAASVQKSLWVTVPWLLLFHSFYCRFNTIQICVHRPDGFTFASKKQKTNSSQRTWSTQNSSTTQRSLKFAEVLVWMSFVSFAGLPKHHIYKLFVRRVWSCSVQVHSVKIERLLSTVASCLLGIKGCSKVDKSIQLTVLELKTN